MTSVAERAPVAKRVTITPQNTESLNRLGLRVAPEVIPPGENRDEQAELAKLPPGEVVLGGSVKIDYNIRKGGRVFDASVNYTITGIQPPNADRVDKTTTVEIVGESQAASSSDEFLDKLTRQALQNRLLALMDDIELAEEDGSNAKILRAEVASIESQLLRY